MSTVLLPQPTPTGPGGVSRYRAAILTLEPDRNAGTADHVSVMTYDFNPPRIVEDPEPTLAGVVRQLRDGRIFRASPDVRADLTEILRAQDLRRRGEDTGLWIERMSKEASESSD